MNTSASFYGVRRSVNKLSAKRTCLFHLKCELIAFPIGGHLTLLILCGTSGSEPCHPPRLIRAMLSARLLVGTQFGVSAPR